MNQLIRLSASSIVGSSCRRFSSKLDLFPCTIRSGTKLLKFHETKSYPTMTSNTHPKYFSTFPNEWHYDHDYIDDICKQFVSDPVGSIKLNKDDNSGIATICMSNPGKKNCLSGYMMVQLLNVLKELEHWEHGKAVVLYGENEFFSSGGDLDTVRTIANREGGRKMISLMQHNLDRLQSLPLLTVAYVRGMALGGGSELLTACDYRLATPDATIGFVQVRIGIMTAWGGGARLTKLIGYNKALDLIGTGRTVPAQEAFELGLFDKIIEHDSEGQEEQVVRQKSQEFLKNFLRHPRHTMLMAKQICNDTRRIVDNLDSALDKELQHALKIWGGPVHRAALQGKVNHNKKWWLQNDFSFK